MNKMQMAHQMALAMAANGDVPNENIVAIVWEYAEAMQAEADEREDKTRPKALLTKDKDGKCLHFNHEFGHKKCMDCGASLEEWQPDWRQAPAGYNYWVATADHTGKISGGWFYDVKPEIGKSDGVSIYYSSNSNAVSTESFDYQGNWQDSLRKRPQ